MTTLQAIGFDLGETLIHYQGVPLNWHALYPQALARVAEACGSSLESDQLAGAVEILSRYNTRLHPRQHEISADQIFMEILACWHISTSHYLSSAKDAFFTFFQQKMLPYEETLPTLQALHAYGIKVGVLTDVPYGMERRYIECDLQMLADCLDAVVTSAEVGYRKPDPRGYLALARRLQVQPEHMLFVGNEEKDIIGACDAGMFAVLIDREARALSYGEQLRISALDQLFPLFRY